MKRHRSSPPPLRGRIAVPGDKSISHRAALVAALADGTSEIRGCNLGADVRSTLGAIETLGARVTIVGESPTEAVVEVEGNGWDGLSEPGSVIDAGNSGTTMRILAGICASVPAFVVVTGDASLRERPMGRVVAPLRRMGARIEGRRDGDRAPLAIRGGPLEGIDAALSVASAQVKSALILAGLRAEGATTIVEPRPSRDHTERLLAHLGAPVEAIPNGIRVAGGGWQPSPEGFAVPGDISSAAFLIVAATLIEGSELTLTGVGVNPGRRGVLDALARMGAALDVSPGAEILAEPRADLTVAASPLVGISVGPEEVVGLIDELPIVAVAATQAEGTTTIRGAGELRVKESDRIAALAQGLSALGARIEESPDGLRIEGPTPLTGGEVDARNDHRIALAFAVAGLIARGNVRIKGWSSVETSFPEFLDVLGIAQRTKR